jgi:two-component system cell cycle response regulator
MSVSPVILLVDDESASRQALEAVLDGQGYELHLAENGQQALEQAADLVPDLILLDVMMPGMDGFEVCQLLRTDPALAEVPIVLVTALDDRESRIQGLEAGADDFVSKPFNRAELRARVRTITRLNRYRRLLNERLKFEWIANLSNDGFVLVDGDGLILYANPQACRFLDAEESQQDPAGQDFLTLAQQQYLCEPEDAWAQWPRFESGADDATQHTCYLVRPETFITTALWLAVDVLEQPAVTGNTQLLSLRDVTQQVTSWRDMRTFHTAIGHKLLTPLNVLVGSLEVIASDKNASRQEMFEMVDLAYDGSSRLQETIEEILFYLKGDSLLQIGGHTRMQELTTLVQRVADRLELSEPMVQVADTLTEASTGLSAQSLEWMLWELFENSRKFHPQQAPSIEVDASLDAPGWARIIVADDGVSLSADQISRVWTPYYQGEKYFTGETPGMGLGLPAVAATVWNIGGSCHLYNRVPGPGVVVELTIPLLE